MAGLFGGGNQPQSKTTNILTALKVTRSVLGSVLPLIFGQARMPVILLWYDDFVAIPVKSKTASGGKGGGGGSTTTTYDYQAAVVCTPGIGPLQGVYRIWDSSGNLIQSTVAEVWSVPGGGGNITVTHHSNFYDDFGVGRQDSYSQVVNDYGSPGPVTLSGNYNTPMKKVASSPTAGQYSVNLSTGVYTFAAADAGKQVTINYTYLIPDSTGTGNPAQILAFTFLNGAQGQSPWSYLTSKHPGKDLGYSLVACIDFSPIDLGSSGTMPSYNYEVIGRNSFGGGITDCNPVDIIKAILTDSVIGQGFPSANIDDWITPNSSAWNYWTANGFFISPVLDTQRPCAQVLQEWLDAGNVASVWSEGLLKLRPYGDVSVAGNGSIYVTNNSPIVDLTDDDFIPGNGDPVVISRTPWQDAFNCVQLEWANRSNSYNPEIDEEKDQNSIELFGLRVDNSITAHFITTQAAAQFAAQTRLKRNVYIRKQYKFTIGWRYCYLEPMDLVTLTDSSLGLNKTPVRITDIEENETGEMQITAEEFPWGTATPTLYSKQGTSGFAQSALADPGSINTPIIFEASSAITRQSGYEIWMAISGSTPASWGGCHIWMSTDGTNYMRVAGIIAPARMGTTTATLPIPTITNYALYSEQMDNAAWSKVFMSVTADTTTAPNGTTTADTLTNSPHSGLSNFSQSVAYSGTTNPICSIYVKANSLSFVTISVQAGSVSSSVRVDLSSGAISGSPTGNYTVTSVGSGWYRITSAPSSAATGSGNIVLTVGPCNSSGTNTAGTLYLWGGQIEKVPYAQSNAHAYVQTTSASATATDPTADPDTDSTLSVDLTESLGILTAGTQADADNLRTLCYVDGEYVSYENAVLTATNKYDLSYLRRGQLGSTIASHSSGSAFARLDQTIFILNYDPTLIGTTVHFKFTSFNTFGNREQNLSNATDYTIPIAGLGLGAVDHSSGALLGSLDLTGSNIQNRLPTAKSAYQLPASNTNKAKVDSIDAGSNATIRIYDAVSGVTTNPWARYEGSTSAESVPAGTITGVPYTVTRFVSWNGSTYISNTNFTDSLSDSARWSGKVTTVASGGGGGITGGGGSGGDSGGGAAITS